MQAEAGITQPLPWHLQQWQHLSNAQNRDRFPHALLMVGQTGLGKRAFARHLSNMLLCEAPDWAHYQPCAQCAACAKTANDAHPDFRKLGPQEGKKEISVDDARNILNFLQLSNQSSTGYKVVTVDPADCLSRSAANALLKTLEEPAKKRVIILVAESMGKIPATIRSRCQLLRFSLPSSQSSHEWLASVTGNKYAAAEFMTEGRAPLSLLSEWENTEVDASQRAESLRKEWLAVINEKLDPLTSAHKWSESNDQSVIIDWLHQELLSGLRQAVSGDTTSGDKKTLSVFVIAQLNIQAILTIQNEINKLTALLDTNANNRLLWETFLLQCKKLAAYSKVTTADLHRRQDER